MNRKLAIILILLAVSCDLGVNAPKAQATAFTFDIPQEISGAIQATSGVSEVVKDYILKPAIRIIARALLSKLSSAIISKIQNGGPDNKPAFVQDWTQLITGAQQRGENVFRAELAGSTICSDFAKGLKQTFGVGSTGNVRVPAGQNTRTDSLQPFNLQMNCTMPQGFSNQKYQQDFAGNGGWDAWSRMLEPQNNVYGAMLLSMNEVAKQRSLAQNGSINEALAGGGYTSVRGGPGGAGSCQDAKLAPGAQGPVQQSSEARCTFLGKIVTPGDILGKSAASTIDNELGWITSSQDLASVVIDVVTAVVNRLGSLATANTAGDYSSAPKVTDTTSQTYLSCINSCTSGTDTTCQTQCAQDQGYKAPSSTCSAAVDGTITCTTPTSLCINSSALSTLKNPVVIPAGHGWPVKIHAWKDAVPAWAAISKKIVGIGDTIWFHASILNTEAPLNLARTNIATDPTQLGNDGKLKSLLGELEILATFVNSDANDGTLTFNTQRDTMLGKIYKDYDSLVGEPDCSTLPPPTSTTFPPNSTGPSGTCTAANEHPPILPTDLAGMTPYIIASFKGMNNGTILTPSDIAFWAGYADHYGAPYSDGICRIGWNAYWEAAMAPGYTGVSNPKLGDQLPRFMP